MLADLRSRCELGLDAVGCSCRRSLHAVQVLNRLCTDALRAASAGAQEGIHAQIHSVVSAESAWDLMEKARAARTNVQEAIRLKDDEQSLGCSSSRADFSIQKKVQMYQERASVAFIQLDHWNLVADPGTHTYKEIMPAVL